jgi:hypothetical protein
MSQPIEKKISRKARHAAAESSQASDHQAGPHPTRTSPAAAEALSGGSGSATFPELSKPHPSNTTKAGPGQGCEPGEITIDPEFAALIHPAAKEEIAQLEQNLRRDGACRDPLAIWKGTTILLDGHNRLALCTKHRIGFQVVAIDLPDRAAAQDWILANQLGRRNLSPEQIRYLRGKRYNLQKQPHGGARKSAEASAQKAHLTTAEALAQQYHVAPTTIRRDAELAQQVDTIVENCGSEAKHTLLAHGTLTKKQIKELAQKSPEEQRQALAPKAPGEEPRQPPPAQATKKTITLPTNPEDLVPALLRRLGRECCQTIHRLLGTLLRKQSANGTKRSKGRSKTTKVPAAPEEPLGPGEAATEGAVCPQAPEMAAKANPVAGESL